MKFSHAWKIVAMYLCILSMFVIHIKKRTSQQFSEKYACRTLKAGYFIIAWVVFAGMLHEGVLSSIIIASQRLLPVMFLHFLLISRFNSEEIVHSITMLVIFVMLSTVPFHLHMLEPLGQGYDVISLLGAEKVGLVGIFQNQHAAALSFSLCAIIATVSFLHEDILSRKVVVGIVAVFLLIFSIMTYARSGLAAYAMGVIMYLRVSGKTESLLRLAIFAVVVVSVFSLSFSEMDVLKNRFLGRTMYSDVSTSNLDSASSGRLLFWKTALDIFSEQNPLFWAVGIGEDQLKKEMGERVYEQIFAHNGFINELLNNGIIGLLLLIYLYKCIYLDLSRIVKPSLKYISYSAFGSWLAFAFFQGGEFPLQFLIIMLFVYYSEVCTIIPNFTKENSKLCVVTN